jgi:hypothetical protein
VVLAAGLLLPAVAQGAGSSAGSPTGFKLRASNGYDLVGLVVTSPEGDEGEIALYLTARDRHGGALYEAPATVTPTTVDADLGRLGRISVRRVRTGGTRTIRRGCKPGEKERVRAERYEGTIEFHGEEGFADATASSAPLEHPNLCSAGQGEIGRGSPPKSLPGARLDVEKRRPEEYRLEFDALQKKPGGKTGVAVEVEEARGEMTIARYTWTWARPDALRYDRELRSATVKPPAPFAGAAHFRTEGDRGRWTGNLTADLPGRANVPITGPGFDATLEHPRR